AKRGRDGKDRCVLSRLRAGTRRDVISGRIVRVRDAVNRYLYNPATVCAEAIGAGARARIVQQNVATDGGVEFEGILQPVGQSGNIRSADEDDIVLGPNWRLNIRIGKCDGLQIVYVHAIADADGETLVDALRRDVAFPFRNRDVTAAVVGSDAAPSGRRAVGHEVND